MHLQQICKRFDTQMDPENTLKNRIALVTGASRGIGKGIAIALAKAGATVYITSRSLEADTSIRPLEGSLEDTLEIIKGFGGDCTAIACDHSIDSNIQDLFKTIQKEQGCLDILVNNAWAGYQIMQQGESGFGTKFWKHKNPAKFWDSMFDVGVRSHYLASTYAANLMVKQSSALIVHLTSSAGFKYTSNVAYGVSKAAVNRMTADMAHELKKHNIAVVALCPGRTKTEMILSRKGSTEHNESPEFVGRSIVALASDPKIMDRSGQTLITRELAIEYSFTDIDGKQPTTTKGF